MSKKHLPNDDELRDLLFEGHAKPSTNLPPSDPIMPTPMAIPLDEIQPYERNPRRAHNEAWEEILHSLRASGYRGRFPVTRRPGDTHYIPAEGGNTTLMAMKSLAAEGDDRFDPLSCEFIPWESESKTIVAHLVENDARADLIFIDKAQALRDARELLEAELGRELSMGELAKELKNRGYAIDKSLISRLEYALHVLYPALPVAFDSGAGQPLVEKLRRLDNAARRLVSHYREGDAQALEHARRLMVEVLGRHDAEEIDHEAVLDDLADTLSEWLEQDRETTLLELELLQKDPKLELSQLEPPPPPMPPAPPPGAETPVAGGGASAPPEAPRVPSAGTGDEPPPAPPGPPPVTGPRPEPSAATGGAETTAETTPASGPPGGTESPPPSSTPSSAPPATAPTVERPLEAYTVDEIQRLVQERARAVGDYAGIGHLVQPSIHMMGYFIDLPPADIPLGENPILTSAIWWWLATASQQMAYPHLYVSESENRPVPWADCDYIRVAREVLRSDRYSSVGELPDLMAAEAEQRVPFPHSSFATLHLYVTWPLTVARDEQLVGLFDGLMRAIRATWRIYAVDEAAEMMGAPELRSLEV